LSKDAKQAVLDRRKQHHKENKTAIRMVLSMPTVKKRNAARQREKYRNGGKERLAERKKMDADLRRRIRESKARWRAKHPDIVKKHRQQWNLKCSTDPKTKAAQSKYKADWRTRNPNKVAASLRKRLAKLKENPKLVFQQRLMCRIRQALHNSNRQSITMATYTAFSSGQLVRQHFRSQYKPGMRDWNYGWFWSIAHNIAIFWYDKNDPEDMKRCNSPANLSCDYAVSGMGEPSNSQKGIKLPDEASLFAQGVESWPKAWNGVVPSVEWRHAYIRKCRGR
jgi:hypothetical protein